MAYIKNIGGRAAGSGGASGMFQRPNSINNNVAQSEVAAGKTSPRARVQGLARAAELKVKDSMAMRSRVQGLARGQEIKMGQDLAKQAVAGKASHADLSNTAKAARGRAFAKRQAILKNRK